jgi:hypothetical protein
MVDENRLDALLGAWALQQRLDQRQAEEILLAVTGQVREPLPDTWWQDLSTHVSEAVVLATMRPPTGLAA